GSNTRCPDGHDSHATHHSQARMEKNPAESRQVHVRGIMPLPHSSESLLEIKRITKTYPGEGKNTTVLDHISFKVQNELLCIVGPSGCGKSTLLRIIDGLDKPTSGQVLFHGQPITAPSPKIGVIFQKFALIQWKTVLGNV